MLLKISDMRKGRSRSASLTPNSIGSVPGRYDHFSTDTIMEKQDHHHKKEDHHHKTKKEDHKTKKEDHKTKKEESAACSPSITRSRIRYIEPCSETGDPDQMEDSMIELRVPIIDVNATPNKDVGRGSSFRGTKDLKQRWVVAFSSPMFFQFNVLNKEYVTVEYNIVKYISSQ